MIIDSVHLKCTSDTSDPPPPPYQEIAGYTIMDYPTVDIAGDNSVNSNEPDNCKPLHRRMERSFGAHEEIADGLKQVADSSVTLIGDFFVAAGGLLQGTGKVLSGFGKLVQDIRK